MSAVNAVALLAAAGGDYQISRSVRLRSSASANLNRTYASAGSQTTWTYSAWVKRGVLSSGLHDIFRTHYSATYHIGLYFNASDTLSLIQWTGSVAINLTTTQVFRDSSAWYHIIVVVDTTQATSSNRVKLYVNGAQITSFGTATYPTQNSDTYMCSSTGWTHLIGKFYDFSTTNYFDGYLTEVNFIDGQALTPSSFGEFDAVTGVWKPKKYAGTYGTNGFYLNFSDNSAATAAAIGKDWSGNGNNWTPNNISVTAGVTYDSMLDTPTPYADGGNGRGNYAVLNPSAWRTTYSHTVPTNGNLTCTSADNSRFFTATMAEIDKTYFELVATTVSGSGVSAVIWQSEDPQSGAVSALSYISATGVVSVLGTTVFTGATFTSGDVIGLAHDSAAGTVAVYKNGTLQGTATGLPTSINLYAGCTVGVSSVVNANFGQRPFSYTPPTGFKALNTQNLPDATIKKGNAYFDVTTYTGNGSTQSIVNSGAMQPNLVWLKSRSSGAYSHVLYDSVRGATKRLFSNLTNAEDTAATGLTAFNSDGFTLGSQTTTNDSAVTFVGWQWKESASAGFDIVTYTGNGTNQTINHSLGVAPKMIIVKSRSAAVSWPVYHASIAATSGLFLNLTNAAAATSSWNGSAPSSSSFTVGATAEVNANTATYVAYLFAEVAGYSKFGSYTGNGSADGPFVYCGFRPRFVMAKRTDAADGWYMLDTSRDSYNVAKNALDASSSGAEFATADRFDFLSNGFKLKASAAGPNISGGTYIYAAFAENPFKNSLAR